jgi:hypothetical protein
LHDPQVGFGWHFFRNPNALASDVNTTVATRAVSRDRAVRMMHLTEILAVRPARVGRYTEVAG